VVCDTPLVFVGVGERILAPPEVGARVPGGARALHVVVVPRPGNARRWSRSFDRFARARASQWRGWSPSFVDSYLVDSGRVELPPTPLGIAFDGEITSMRPPLEYRLWRDALHLLVRK
jgi:hypothetical protein